MILQVKATSSARSRGPLKLKIDGSHLAVHVDVAINSNSTAAGMVMAFNDAGIITFVGTTVFETLSPELVETKALLWAFNQAAKEDWIAVNWRCDAQVVVNQVKDSSCPRNWNSRNLLLNIRTLLECYPWTLSWVPRIINTCADRVAKLALKNNSSFIFRISSFEGIPFALLSLISEEVSPSAL